LETNFVALFSCYLSIQTICIVKSAVKNNFNSCTQ